MDYALYIKGATHKPKLPSNHKLPIGLQRHEKFAADAATNSFNRSLANSRKLLRYSTRTGNGYGVECVDGDIAPN